MRKKLLILIGIAGILSSVGALLAATSQGQSSETLGKSGETGVESRAEVPHPPDGAPEAPPPASEYSAPATTTPVLADSSIAATARKESELAGEESPTMSAVDTTLQKAVETNPSNEVPDNPVTEALMKSEVVLVVMRGHFELTRAHLPQGDSKIPTGTVFTLAVDAQTGRVDFREISAQPASGIAALGVARTLG